MGAPRGDLQRNRSRYAGVSSHVTENGAPAATSTVTAFAIKPERELDEGTDRHGAPHV